MKKGFTLAELLMVIVIAGILAAIALPNFSKSVEKGKAKQAIAYLRLIRSAQKIYASNNNGVYACAAGTPCTNPAQIKSVLNLEITAENYTFTVAAGDPATTFTATATRTDGTGKTITLTDACVWGGNDDFKLAADAPC